MRIDIITVFPDMVQGALGHSILARAQQDNLIGVNVVDLRDFTADKRRTVDHPPYGGGAGMVIKPEPVFDAVESLGEPRGRVVLMTPQGRTLTQQIAKELAAEDRLVLICGHYEGFDERIRQHLVDDEISIGDYVLTGGELPALVLVDSVSRLLPGVLGNAGSLGSESFDSDLLEYPQFTRPATYRGWSVPDVLLSGHHAEIEKWRLAEREERTRQRRPDMWARHLAGKPAAQTDRKARKKPSLDRKTADPVVGDSATQERIEENASIDSGN
jgi:tRNA (guanine37-N1)-methyltransferase